ncbi:PTS sugar transporter subunit IIA [bacterium]|nr:PTS sugar transporter subunit IIA [bacterium]
MELQELSSYFNGDLFIPELQATTKDACLAEMVELFENTKVVKNKTILLEMLKKRESLGSTGVGKGIAIPHGRTTTAQDVLIVFGKSSKGIEYDSVDQKPAKLVFMVIAPPVERGNKYLPVLGKLVEVVNSDKKREALQKVTTFEELMNCFE